MPFTFFSLEWDSTYFGFPCAKAVITGHLTKQDADAFLEKAKAFRFITICNPDSFSENNDILTTYFNALQTDVNIRLCNKTPVALPDAADGAFDIQIADNMSLPDSIFSATKHAFSHSRFYKDPHISPEKANGVFESWIKNAQNKEGEYFCLCSHQEKLAGFLLFHFENGTDAIIELVFVSPDCRGSGVATAMLQQCSSFCAEHGMHNMYIGTQKRNDIALQVYQKNMYQEENVTHIFHMWNK